MKLKQPKFKLFLNENQSQVKAHMNILIENLIRIKFLVNPTQVNFFY